MNMEPSDYEGGWEPLEHKIQRSIHFKSADCIIQCSILFTD